MSAFKGTIPGIKKVMPVQETEKKTGIPSQPPLTSSLPELPTSLQKPTDSALTKALTSLPKVPSPSIKPPLPQAEVVKKSSIDFAVPKTSSDGSLNEEARLRFRIQDLETKLQIQENYRAGMHKNDREYIEKLEKSLAAEKQLQRSLMARNAELMNMLNPDRVVAVQSIQDHLDVLETPRPITLTQRCDAAELIRTLYRQMSTK